MARSIVIVGGLPGDPDRNDVLSKLKGRSGEAVNWDWIRSDLANSDRPPQKYLNGLMTQLQRKRAQTAPNSCELTVIKLFRLHGQIQGQIHRWCDDPVLAPADIQSVEEFVDWVFSPATNLFPNREWFGNVREAALVALFSKLVRNKSWNNNTQGHQWTKEIDLLGQAPVSRPDNQRIAIEAGRMLGSLGGTLLLKKGGTKGTPKEWSIRLTYLIVVKQIITNQSFSPLSAYEGLKSLAAFVSGGDVERTYRLDGEIVTEKIREICRSSH